MKIRKDTKLYLSPQGNICTVVTGNSKDRSLAVFTVEALEMGIAVKAVHGDTKADLEPQAGGTMKRTVEQRLDELDEDNILVPGPLQRLTTSLTIPELLAESGLTLDDEPYAEYVLTAGKLPEHLPNAGAPVTVRPNTTLYLTPMGTIGLSAAAEHGHVKHFTVLDLRSGRTASIADQRLAASIVPEGNDTVRYTNVCQSPPNHEMGTTSIRYLLELHGFILEE